MPKVIIARYHGTCKRCKSHIYPNQRVILELGGCSHPVCVPDEEKWEDNDECE